MKRIHRARDIHIQSHTILFVHIYTYTHTHTHNKNVTHRTFSTLNRTNTRSRECESLLTKRNNKRARDRRSNSFLIGTTQNSTHAMMINDESKTRLRLLLLCYYYIIVPPSSKYAWTIKSGRRDDITSSRKCLRGPTSATGSYAAETVVFSPISWIG
jgi:hypothetical protein